MTWRLLPVQFPGKMRLARCLFWPFSDIQDVQVADKWGCEFVVPNLRSPIGFCLVTDGVYEPLTMQFLLRHLRDGSVFIDVGAAIGVFTIPMAKLVGERGCVLAIEPSPTVFPYLRRNAELNHLRNVRLKNCAAYDRNVDDVSFYEAPLDHFGMGSLAAQFHGQPVSVHAQTLDSILAEERIHHVDMIKVDVEGCEDIVFRGAKRLLTTTDAPIILFEFCDWAEARVPGARPGNAQAVLREYGYKIWRLPDFLGKRRGPSKEAITKGFEMLVAVKR